MRAECAVAGRRLHMACVNLEASTSQPCSPVSSGVSALENQLRDKLREAMQLQARFDAEKVELNSRYNMSVCLRTRPIHFSPIIYKCHHAWAGCCNKYVRYWQLGLNYRIQRISQSHKFQHLSQCFELKYWCPELTSPRWLIVHCPECWHTGKVSMDCFIYPTMWHAKTREKKCLFICRSVSTTFFSYLYNVSVVYDTFFWERIHGSDRAGMGSSDEWSHCSFSLLHLFISDSFIMERAEITLHFDIWTFSWALLKREERAIDKWGSNKCTIERLIILPQPC